MKNLCPYLFCYTIVLRYYMKYIYQVTIRASFLATCVHFHLNELEGDFGSSGKSIVYTNSERSCGLMDIFTICHCLFSMAC